MPSEGVMPSSEHRFRKYGMIFESNEGQPVQGDGQPESPYEALPAKTTAKRKLSPLEQEQEELNELRGTKDSHWD